jgi:hypothetical protein
MITKGKMIQELKKCGVRRGEKNGASVQLEHLKQFEIIKLYTEYCTKD